MERIMAVLPSDISQALGPYIMDDKSDIEEIRLRIAQPVEIIMNHRSVYPREDLIFTKKQAEQLLSRLSEYSLYTLEEELKRGYVTIKGGHRVGLAGRVIMEHGKVKRIRDISSFNIRVARQTIGAADHLVPKLCSGGKWHSALFIGSPQAGKTTLLRDLARIISQGQAGIPAKKVGVVDERSEIAGCLKGIPQNQLGPRVDVLDACPKAEGMMMLIRSMSPDVLIVDEIGRQEDTNALLEALNAGVSVMATVHGQDFEDIAKRPLIQPLLHHQIFTRFIELNRRQRPGQIKQLLNAEGKPIQAVMHP